MKIGLLAPSIYMSAAHYGEMIFAPRDLAISLADGLTERGHEVYFFTSPDTKTQAKLVGGDHHLLSKDIIEEKMQLEKTERAKWASFYGAKRNYEIDLTARCYRMALAGKIEIVHSFHDTMAHFFEYLTQTATVYTLHDPLPQNKNSLAYWLLNKFKNHQYISISNSSRKHDHLKLNFIETVYHGLEGEKFTRVPECHVRKSMDEWHSVQGFALRNPELKDAMGVKSFTFQDKPSDYLLFMGRPAPEKGLPHAIAAALRLNLHLKIGTCFPDKYSESEYFLKEIKPCLNNPLIGKPGMLKGEEKIALYKQAKALLFPILWEEPFGMVMIEAMACGTPVIAYARGSVPEVVVDGVTGYIVEPESNHLSDLSNLGNLKIKKRGLEGLIEAVKTIYSMPEGEYRKMRANCRRHVEEKFTVEKMVKGYERVYRKVIGTSG